MANFKATLLAAGETLELVMYDFIGEDFFAEGITDKMVAAALDASPAAKTIRIRMNSPGGDAFAGFAIANLLARHPARKEMDVDGLCASVATVIAMQCAEIRMGLGAQMMIHEASGGRRGKANDLRAAADALDGLTQDAAQAYATRTGQPKAALLALMADETWFTAQKAVDIGLADKVVARTAGGNSMAATMRAWCAQLGFKNAPAELAAITEPEQPAEIPARDPSERTEAMTMKKIAKMLGLSESASEEAFETALSTVLDARATAERKAKDAEGASLQAQTDLKAAQATVERFETVLGEKGDAAFGALDAHMANSKKLADAEALLAAQAKAADETKRAALIEKGKAEGKLDDGYIKLYADKPVSEFEAFLKVAKRIVPEPYTQPENNGGSGDAVLKHNGKTYAEMSGTERDALYREDEALFNQMRAQSLKKR